MAVATFSSPTLIDPSCSGAWCGRDTLRFPYFGLFSHTLATPPRRHLAPERGVVVTYYAAVSVFRPAPFFVRPPPPPSGSGTVRRAHWHLLPSAREGTTAALGTAGGTGGGGGGGGGDGAEGGGDDDDGSGGGGGGGGLTGAEASRVERLAAFQEAALRHALSFPAVARVTYSTCSVHARENEQARAPPLLLSSLVITPSLVSIFHAPFLPLSPYSTCSVYARENEQARPPVFPAPINNPNK